MMFLKKLMTNKINMERPDYEIIKLENISNPNDF